MKLWDKIFLSIWLVLMSIISWFSMLDISQIKYTQTEINDKLNTQQPITYSTWQDYSNQFNKLNKKLSWIDKRLDSLEVAVWDVDMACQTLFNK
jgi:hypothetical protein